MKLNFKKLGEGEPIIILHGLFGSLDNWMTLAKKWAKSYQVFLVDQRNHGKSPHSENFSYPEMAKDLLELIKTEKIEKPIILGHSMGGKTAMEFAVNNPILLEKLIVVDIAPVKYKVHHYEIIAALESVDLQKITSRKEAEEFLKNNIKEFGVRQFLLKNLYRVDNNTYNWRFNLEGIKAQIEPISFFDISEKKFSKPTLFIKGENSNYILPEYEKEIIKKFPNYEVQTIKKAGHWVHAESPEAFSQSVLKFLEC